jgi:pyridoxal phosphate enzyme (YggS family)
MLNIDALKKLKNEVGEGVTIVAATKTVVADIINQLPQHGIHIAGENRVQELLTKFDIVSNINWHFIGRLQTNKVKYIVNKVSMIQSVDREKLVDEIQRQCQKIGKTMDVLMQINVGESSKGGVDFAQAQSLAKYISEQKNLRLKGLMCLPPIDADKKVYKDVKKLFDQLKTDFVSMEYLSMGMSGDYQVAIECGANMIRPGSILFGSRGG